MNYTRVAASAEPFATLLVPSFRYACRGGHSPLSHISTWLRPSCGAREAQAGQLALVP